MGDVTVLLESARAGQPLAVGRIFELLYPELKRLGAEGLVESQTDGPRRKTTYAITIPGRFALVEWLGRVAEPDQVRSELLLKLYFAAFAGPAVRQGHLEQLAASGRRTVGWLEQAEAQLSALVADDSTHPHALAVVRLGLATQRAQLAWAEAELRIESYRGSP